MNAKDPNVSIQALGALLTMPQPPQHGSLLKLKLALMANELWLYPIPSRPDQSQILNWLEAAEIQPESELTASQRDYFLSII